LPKKKKIVGSDGVVTIKTKCTYCKKKVILPEPKIDYGN
jgi:hypothetical protein